MDEYSTPKPMKRVGDLFERYRTRFKAPQATVKKECVVVIREVTGFDISLEQIDYNVQTKTISLQVPSILKSELKFYNKKILEQLVKKLGAETAPKTIR